MYDNSSNIVTDSSLSASSVYTVTVGRSISGASTNFVMATRINTTSSITFSKPPTTKVPTEPLSGYYTFTCFNSDGTSKVTSPIPVIDPNSSWQDISYAIGEACPEFKGTIDMWEGTTYNGY